MFEEDFPAKATCRSRVANEENAAGIFSSLASILDSVLTVSTEESGTQQPERLLCDQGGRYAAGKRWRVGECSGVHLS
jgi:hypothetical protein